MPEKVVVEREKDTALAKVKQDIFALKAAWLQLKFVKDFSFPNDLKKLSAADLDTQLEKRLNAVENDFSMTENEKADRREKWKRLYRSAVANVNVIAHILESNPELSLTIEEDGTIKELSDIGMLAAKRAIRDVPPLAKEHAKHISKVLDAVRELREFESKNNVRKIRLESLLLTTIDQIAEGWASGSILKNEFYSTTQELIESRYI